MPMSRYQIRSEYGLSDPELYRAADKDDPEALLEGVAMAGLVGVLRQLGDLAEFAAEIFHDLHEEVMVTAARGHDLMIRVQELEAEVPSIERAFLFQTDHSSFFYNAGVDWHPDFRENKNHAAFEDMPRFVMNSYQDCRGPPQLFLLDKYDTGGDGACLKRYTDPAFFKVATSRSSTDGLSNNKTRKAKHKRGPHLDNGAAAVALMQSNPKLHQLFLEEPINKTVHKPGRVKLKKRLNGFPFDTKSGKSYMEKLFITPVEHEMHFRVSRSSPLRLPTNACSEFDPEIPEVRPVSPLRKITQRIKSCPQPDEAGTTQNELMYVNNDASTDETCQGYNLLTTVDESSETDIHLDGARQQADSMICVPLDTASGIDDNPATPPLVELGGENHDLRLKNDWSSSFFQRQFSVSNLENCYSQPSDSHATTSSFNYEDESYPARNSNFISTLVKRTSVRNSFTDRTSLETVKKSCSADEFLESSVSHDNYQNMVVLNNSGHNVELLDMVPMSNDPLCSLPHSDSEEVSSEVQSKGCMSNEVASVLDPIKESGLILGSTSTKNRSSDMQLQANSGILNESNSVNSASTSVVSEYNSVSSTSHSLREDNDDQEVLKPMKSSPLLSHTYDVLHQSIVDSEERIISSKMVGGGRGVDIQDCSAITACKYTETGFDGNSTQLTIRIGETLENLSYSEGLNGLSASQDCFSRAVEASTDFIESCSPHSEIDSNDTLPYARDTYDGQETHAVTRDNFLVSPFSSGSEKSRSNRETDVILNNGFVDFDKPCTPLCNSMDIAGMSRIKGKDAIEANRDSPGFDLTEASGPADAEVSSYSIRENSILPVEPEDFAANPVSRFSDVGGGILAGDYRHPQMNHLSNKSEVIESSCSDRADSRFTEWNNYSTVATNDNSDFLCSETNIRNLGYFESPDALDSNLDTVIENSCDHMDATSSKQHHFLDEGQHSLLQSAQQSEIYYADTLCVNEGTVIQEGQSSPPYHLENKIIFSSETHGRTSVLENQGNMVKNVPGFPKETSNFASPLRDEDKVTLNETPPLPPLPPFKWRVGRLPHFPVGSRELANDNRPLSAEIFMPSPSGDAMSLGEEISCSTHSIDVSSQVQPRSPVSGPSLIHTTFPHHPPVIEPREQQQLSYMVGEVGKQSKFLTSEITIPDKSSAASEEESINQSSSLSEATSVHALDLTPEAESKEQQHSFVVVKEAVNHKESVPAKISMQAASGEATASIEKISSCASHLSSDMKFKEGNAEQGSSADADLDKTPCSPEVFTVAVRGVAPASLIEHGNCSAAPFIPETKSKEEKAEKSSAVEPDLIHTHPQPEMESKKVPVDTSDVVDENAYEGGANKGKLPRPRNPLIDAVSVLDRSKLRKVVQNDGAQAPKLPERDSLLEQIRAKSFNLKPAVGSRPRVEPPRTNLQVAAILERVNTIRQACAGSDEDEENWSDS